MDRKQIFLILGIPETKDPKAIRDAYIKGLQENHPEERPEAFMRLRNAYEAALRLAERKDGADSGQNTENAEYAGQGIYNAALSGEKASRSITEDVQLWCNKLQQVYGDEQSRREEAAWKKLLAEPVCDSLDDFEELRRALLSFLAEHSCLPHNIWKLLEDRFQLLDFLKEQGGPDIEEDFIRFMEYNISREPALEYQYGDDESRKAYLELHKEKYIFLEQLESHRRQCEAFLDQKEYAEAYFQASEEQELLNGQETLLRIFWGSRQYQRVCARVCYVEAICAYEEEDEEAALQSCEDCLAKDEGFLPALLLREKIFALGGYIQEAIEDYRRIVLLAPDYEENYWMMAETLMRCGAYQAVQQVLGEAGSHGLRLPFVMELYLLQSMRLLARDAAERAKAVSCCEELLNTYLTVFGSNRSLKAAEEEGISTEAEAPKEAEIPENTGGLEKAGKIQGVQPAMLAAIEGELSRCYLPDDLEQSLYHAKQARSYAPDDFEFLRLIWEIYDWHGHYDEAWRALTEEQEHFGEESSYHSLYLYYCGLSMERLGDYEGARDTFETVWEKEPERPFLDLSIHRAFYCNNSYLNHTFTKKDHKKAIECMEEGFRTGWTLKDLLYYAKILQQGAEYKKAMSAYQRLLSYDPGCLEAWQGLIWCGIRDYSCSQQLIERALQYFPEEPSLYQLAALRFGKNHHFDEKALEWHQKGIRQCGERYRKYMGDAGDAVLSLENAKDRFAEAESYYDELEQDPSLRFDYLRKKARLYQAQGDKKKALHFLKRGAETLPDKVQRALMWKLMAEVYMDYGTYHKAAECLKEAIALAADSPERIHMQSFMIAVYYMWDKTEELPALANAYMDAIKQFYPKARPKDYWNFAPDYPKRQGELGWYELALGHNEEALEAFKQQYSTKPCLRCKDKECFRGGMNLARFYEKTGDWNMAREYYKTWRVKLNFNIEAEEALKRYQIMKSRNGQKNRK